MCQKTYDVKTCKIISKKEIAEGMFDITVFYPEFAEMAKAGQFAHILVPSKTLRRPISICDIDKEKGTLRLVFQIRGEGTALLSQCEEQTFLNIIAPLGNGFNLIDKNKKALFVGGGIGVPPLLAAAKHFGENATVVLGFRDKQSVILEDDFKKTGARVLITTDDGSYGHHGLVTDLIKDLEYDIAYACGPHPMLKAVKFEADKKGAMCQLSLEERMACGVGACLGCACKLKDEDGNEYYGHVCKDGPVFDADNIVF